MRQFLHNLMDSKGMRNNNLYLVMVPGLGITVNKLASGEEFAESITLPKFQ